MMPMKMNTKFLMMSMKMNQNFQLVNDGIEIPQLEPAKI